MARTSVDGDEHVDAMRSLRVDPESPEAHESPFSISGNFMEAARNKMGDKRLEGHLLAMLAPRFDNVEDMEWVSVMPEGEASCTLDWRCFQGEGSAVDSTGFFSVNVHRVEEMLNFTGHILQNSPLVSHFLSRIPRSPCSISVVSAFQLGGALTGVTRSPLLGKAFSQGMHTFMQGMETGRLNIRIIVDLERELHPLRSAAQRERAGVGGKGRQTNY